MRGKRTKKGWRMYRSLRRRSRFARLIKGRREVWWQLLISLLLPAREQQIKKKPPLRWNTLLTYYKYNEAWLRFRRRGRDFVMLPRADRVKANGAKRDLTRLSHRTRTWNRTSNHRRRGGLARQFFPQQKQFRMVRIQRRNAQVAVSIFISTPRRRRSNLFRFEVRHDWKVMGILYIAIRFYLFCAPNNNNLQHGQTTSFTINKTDCFVAI